MAGSRLWAPAPPEGADANAEKNRPAPVYRGHADHDHPGTRRTGTAEPSHARPRGIKDLMRHIHPLPRSLRQAAHRLPDLPRRAASLLLGSPGEAAYALLAPALGLVCGLALLMLLAASLLTAIVQIGLLLLMGTLAAARATGA